MRPVAFDLDGTLLGGMSSERRFARWSFARGELGARQALCWAGFVALAWPRHGVHVAKRDKCYVTGIEIRRVRALAERFVDEELLGCLETATLAELERHRRAGDALLLLSGTLQPIAEALAERLGMDDAAGSVPAVRGARYAFGPPRRHPFGPGKLAPFDAFCAARALAPDRGVAYADSIHDRRLLERVAVPVAVEPDAALARLAAARRWRVLRHRAVLANPDPSVHPR